MISDGRTKQRVSRKKRKEIKQNRLDIEEITLLGMSQRDRLRKEGERSHPCLRPTHDNL